jgi:hypothetical protein
MIKASQNAAEGFVQRRYRSGEGSIPVADLALVTCKRIMGTWRGSRHVLRCYPIVVVFIAAAEKTLHFQE